MITIKLLGANHNQNLKRPTGDRAFMRTPIGMAAPIGSGPAGETCGTCAHFDLPGIRWSNLGRAAFCLERQRLSGKSPQEVPARAEACNRHLKRADAAAAVAAVEDRLGERIQLKREKIEQYRQSAKRLEMEIRELQQMREDPGYDSAWSGFEPTLHDTSSWRPRHLASPQAAGILRHRDSC
jgi:hypothetical protein